MSKVTAWKRAAGAWQGAEPSADEASGWTRLIGGGRVDLWATDRRWAVLRGGEVLLFGEVPHGGEMKAAGLLAIGAGLGDAEVLRRDG